MEPASDEVQIDHVTIAGSDLDRLEAAFESVGIDPDYGGSHDEMPTHMSIIGFEDTTYIELIAKDEVGTAPLWNDAMEGDVGPCAWAVRTSDIDRDVSRLQATGLQVDGPHDYSRERPDGKISRWQLAFPGEGEPGSVLPFLIEDETPLERRVQPTPSAEAAGFGGIDSVVIAVSDLETSVSTFETAFEGVDPTHRSVSTGPFAGSTATFSELPVSLVEPGAGSALSERLDTIGDSPCAFVLEASSPETVREHVGALQTKPCD
ncbi:hypothetical protein AArcSl_1463 [Halalkaliarchaeum desulfuricum]|uniref:Glyoxalase-like domain-containing protein n=1 Tax=Halalkaliarchaeum desulfuricum TaxID=2055893 RepID=A0A343TJ20_9EURY|nr:VOC family protein [Halalkaliarchaeum desulfuricum]AUX09092.1 hypothetical protein AArcSl_1463 [Halalkaliarchaeum desulfuricum]